MVRTGLEPGTSGFQVRRSNHSAMLPLGVCRGYFLSALNSKIQTDIPRELRDGQLFFLREGMRIFPSQTIFCVILCANNFSPVASFSKQPFSCLQTIYLGFFGFANNLFQDFSSPPPPPPVDKVMVRPLLHVVVFNVFTNDNFLFISAVQNLRHSR